MAAMADYDPRNSCSHTSDGRSPVLKAPCSPLVFMNHANLLYSKVCSFGFSQNGDTYVRVSAGT